MASFVESGPDALSKVSGAEDSLADRTVDGRSQEAALLRAKADAQKAAAPTIINSPKTPLSREESDANLTIDGASAEAQALRASAGAKLKAGAVIAAPTAAAPHQASAGDETLDGQSKEAEALRAKVDAKADSLDRMEGAPTALLTAVSGLAFPVEHWDRYEFLELLGQGGMGAVYKARDRKLGRVVALKFIRGHDDQMTARFVQEARAQSRVDHPGICKVHEVGEVDGKPYIAMQFVDGAPLSVLSSQLTLHEKAKIVRDASLALHAAHELGIIHRDIKPANIMIEKRAAGYHPIVMDFGLAREANESGGLTESGTIMGTPGFMSPEQARGDVRKLDCRTDVYSLGATLYAALAGEPPFKDDSVVNVIIKVLTQKAPVISQRVPGIPKPLDVIVARCLAKEPHQRYQSARALADDLTRFLEQKEIVEKEFSLHARLLWKAQNNRPLAAAVLALGLTLLGFVGYGIRTYVQDLAKERAVKRQAELGQRLGQEIKDMEWLLRTARGMPIHELKQEKAIVRRRMAKLHEELAAIGAEGGPLAHYALGRGHMGLHEYPEALKELEQAIAQGVRQGDAYYALGVVLGKHFEKAMYEARLAGGGDWARKRRKEIEPKYLTPAITYLRRARTLGAASPEFLEALLSYYQRDFAAAGKKIKIVLDEAPWLYEAHKLAGDIRLENALQARDRGQDEAAGKELAAAVQEFERAAEVGRSDDEVYEGMAEAWLQQIELAAISGKPVNVAYAAAVAASNNISAIEPYNVSGPLKKAYAALLTMGLLFRGKSSAEQARECINHSEQVLRLDPQNPYASDVLAGCYALDADRLQAEGKDPSPLLRKALSVLEPAVKTAPHFLWGLNDLANVYMTIGSYMQLHGIPDAKSYVLKSIEYRTKSVTLDEAYLVGYKNSLYTWLLLASMQSKKEELHDTLKHADVNFYRCVKLNDKYHQCYNHYFQLYTVAAQRLSLAGDDPQPLLKRALAMQKQARKLGTKFLDTEQGDALLHLVDALDLLRRKESPLPALAEVQLALERCLALAATDATCRAIAVRADWVLYDWLVQTGKPPAKVLQAALQKATLATQSKQTYPDAWWVLGETHLRIALTLAPGSRLAAQHIADGFAALERVFAINGNHARSWATRGALELARARRQADRTAGKASAASAVISLERALKQDELLSHDYSFLLKQARELASSL